MLTNTVQAVPRPDFIHNTTSCNKGQFLLFSRVFDVRMFGEFRPDCPGSGKNWKSIFIV